MSSKLPLSVSIISFNEEEDLPKTLKSIEDIASEIILVDSHSKDKTREIALEFGAKVFVEDWKGHVAQKNSALSKCTQEWILSLDCDEVVTEELKEEIIHVLRNPSADGYLINRRTVYLGKPLKYTWQPDLKLRLVRRGASPSFIGYDPHDSLKIEGKVERLKGEILHYSYKDIYDHFTKVVNYSRIAATSYRKMGKRFKYVNLFFNPFYAFMKEFFLKKAFLDGIRGLIVASSESYYTFLKYLYLWEEERKGS